MGYDTDVNKEWLTLRAPTQCLIADQVMCLYFVSEILCRFMAFKAAKDVCHASYFQFDLFFALLWAWDAWIFPVLHWLVAARTSQQQALWTLQFLHLCRVLRLGRVWRLVRLNRELRTLVLSLGMAVWHGFFIMALVFLTIYVFAIYFTLVIGFEHDDPPTLVHAFRTVPESMNYLLVQGVFADQADPINELFENSSTWLGFQHYVGFLVFLSLVSLTILNMLIGVGYDTLHEFWRTDVEQEDTRKVRYKISKALEHVDVDTNADGRITKQEFHELMCKSRDIVMSEEADLQAWSKKKSFLDSMQEAGIDVIAFMDYLEVIYHGREDMELDEFVGALMLFRGGSNNATMKCAVDIRNICISELNKPNIGWM